jgi:uncharacterized protein (TIGR03437 family)
MNRIAIIAAHVALGCALFGQAPAPGTWTTGTPMPTPRMGMMTGAIGSKIYVVSGENDSSIFTVNEIYDTATNSWSTGAPIPTGRYVAASAVVDGILYAMGGQVKNGPTNLVEAYDPSTDTWTTKSPMPGADDSIYAVVENGTIYVIGGFTPSKGRLPVLYAYHPATDTWTTLASLKVGKSLPAVGLVGSTIVAVGGLSNNGVVADNEGYNAATNTWTTLASQPTARTAGCFEAVGETLYVAGGHGVANGGTIFTSMDAYNVASNSWTTGLAAMPHGVTNSGPASVNGTLYCFGGTNAGDPLQGNIFNYTQIYQPNLQPAISTGGVVSASSFGGFSAISPGSWIEIYGSNLSLDTRGWAGSDFNGNNAPTSLEGTTVTIDGQSAFVDYISPGQVNAQVPSKIATGSQQVVVTTALGVSGPFSIAVNPTQPGLLAPADFKLSGTQYLAALLSDGATYVLPPGAISGVTSQRAHPGDTIIMYGVGFGPVTPDVPAGMIVQQSNTLSNKLQILFGGQPATLSYAGLAPGYVGLYQFNVVVPDVAVSDMVPVTFNLGGAPSTQSLYTAIGN